MEADPSLSRPPLPPRVSGLLWGFRAALVVALLAALTWSWRDAEMSPSLLIDRMPRAKEYIFGRSISPDDRDRALEQARRFIDLGIEREAEMSLRAELEIPTGEPITPAHADALAERVVSLRASMPPNEYDRLVKDRQKQILQQKRGGYFPPETAPESLQLYTKALLETVAIAIWGTLIAIACAVPMAVLGAQRSAAILAPGATPTSAVIRRSMVFFTRRLFDVCRGFNEFVLALIFVAIVGLGPFAGVLALAFHTFGVLGKVISEAIESSSTAEIEAVTATGARPSQIIAFAVFPQIMPYIVSQSLLRFESNVRSASVLGLVGAGGIGFLIDAKLKAYQFPEVATIMILVIIAVTIIDFACSRIMKRFI